MSERFAARLIEPVQAHQAMAAAWTHCKPWLIAGHKLVLEIRKETRSERFTPWASGPQASRIHRRGRSEKKRDIEAVSILWWHAKAHENHG